MRASVPARDHSSGDMAVLRFTVSLRDLEDLLAEQGIIVSYEKGSALGEPFRGRRSLPTYEVAAQSLTPLGISTRSI